MLRCQRKEEERVNTQHSTDKIQIAELHSMIGVERYEKQGLINQLQEENR